ncbi:hypothetical protein XBJ2_170006 [Xenorhabdus bovienii str. Jollieti]|uniref:Uncharacterized protein n=1 Tax=Xenorhabdus bovienii (strain SS-2004) TaxID=406818 RepID=D3UZ95_XENBS|nr:hypothetical protein [Xenorhabdus bovienii]CBJ79677.1 hypothetical protein XBJ1_0533 [Xenorhabdus bovienii SS-2004]CDH28214.1 hypothetical protein XBJ2_170006 [Xenorhabdus bovienii str. Jollieti]
MVKTISQKVARESLGFPEFFEGGVYVTKNGVSELFVQTANERDAELQERVLERQVHALLKLINTEALYRHQILHSLQ